MAERTEEQLARVLRAAADLAPEPVGDLTVSVAVRRRRRRRRRLQTLLAVTGVVAVIGTGMTVTRGTFLRQGDGMTVKPMASTSASVAPTSVSAPDFAPAEKVWPEAVFRIPLTATDGSAYRPVMGLSATEVLLSVEPSLERSGRLEVYDTTTKTTKVLAEMPSPKGMKRYFVQAWDADSRFIVWYATAQSAKGEAVTQFWIVPRRGGEPRLIFYLYGPEAEKVDKVAIAGDRLAWSLATGGVYTIPLSGGRPTRVPGSEGLFLQRWPWAGDRPGRYGTDRESNQSVVVNLETGERRMVTVGDARGLRCGPTWCVGERADAERSAGVIVQHLDGRRREEIPMLRSFPFLDGVVDDRFAVLTVSGVFGYDTSGEEIEMDSPPVAVVYDRVTGTKAAIGARTKDGGGSFGRGTSSSPSNIIYWGVGNAGRPRQYWVLNLAAVR